MAALLRALLNRLCPSEALRGFTAGDFPKRHLPHPFQAKALWRASLPGIGAIVAAAMISLSAGSPARAETVRITSDGGGVVVWYAAKYRGYYQRGVRVIIDGACNSSCTMAVALPRACVTKRAVLGFHSAWSWSPFGHVYDANDTAYLWAQYPPGVKAWLRKRGGLQPALKYMRNGDFDAAGLRRCP